MNVRLRRAAVVAGIVGVFLSLEAAPVGLDTAQNVARNWMHRRTGKVYTLDTSRQTLGRAVSGDKTPTYRIIKLKPQGWVIVAGDDRIDPVLAYGESKIDPGALPPAMRDWMQNIDRVLTKHLSAKPSPKLAASTQTILSKWARLNQANRSLSVRTAPSKLGATSNSIQPLLWLGGVREEDGIRWSQEQYYNAQCPEDNNSIDQSRHALVGCVATAMGQVMRYYASVGEPMTGSGSFGYEHSIQEGFQHDYGWLSADFGSTSYDWDNMPTRLDENSSDESIDAVATLLYHLGVSVRMDYGNGNDDAGSQSYYHDPDNGPAADTAMRKYFGFGQAVWKSKDGCYTDAKWETMLKDAIETNNPILYGGLLPGGYNGGHAFVLDGYSGSLFHVNWGWNGEGNGYFPLNILEYKNQGDYSCCPQAIFPKGILGDDACDMSEVGFQEGDDDGHDSAGIAFWPAVLPALLGLLALYRRRQHPLGGE